MSDLHLTKDGYPIWETNTMEHINLSIDVISGMQDIDAIVVTGDILNDGSEWTYKYADKLFSSLGIPTFCCPGNHDSLNMMPNEFRPSFYKEFPPSCMIKGWNLIMLNSVIPDKEEVEKNKSRGFLTEKSMSFLIQNSNEGFLP